MSARMVEIIVTILLPAVLGGVFTLVGVSVLPVLKNDDQGYPGEREIESAVLPFAFQAICAAFKMSERAAEELGAVMDGVDKKAIADAAYDLLPASLNGIPVGVIKDIISREKFVELVEDAYSYFKLFFDAQVSTYDQLFEEWKREYQAGQAQKAAA